MAETKTQYPPSYGYRGHKSLRGVRFQTSLDDLAIPVFSVPKKTPSLSWGLTFDASTDPNTWILGPDGGDKGAYFAIRLVIEGKTYEAGKEFAPGPGDKDHSVDRAFEYQRNLEEKLERLYRKIDVNY